MRNHLADTSCIALDLPGYGDRAACGYTDVAAMADDVVAAIRRHDLSSFVLVGHSMGGKIATILASRAMAGEADLTGLVGVVLVAASPPSPEPIEDGRRAEMIGWMADGPIGRNDAETFVDANSSKPLSDALRETAVADVKQSSREAWLGWLERGSREDWSHGIEPITIPALIVAGGDDGDLGEAAQRRLNLPFYPQGDLHVIDGAAHLIPYEQPEALADLIAVHVARLEGSILPDGFVRLLRSDRVSRRTRAAMLERTRPLSDEASGWSSDQLDAVAALIARVLPDLGPDRDLARRVGKAVHGPGDGWRFADLPPDADAWAKGLATLDTLTGGFTALSSQDQSDWLTRVDAGQAGIGDDPAHLSPEQMTLWFQDVRADIVRQWMATPAAMAAIGYDGFAVGGDGPRKQGYTRTTANDTEGWQHAIATSVEASA